MNKISCHYIYCETQHNQILDINNNTDESFTKNRFEYYANKKMEKPNWYLSEREELFGFSMKRKEEAMWAFWYGKTKELMRLAQQNPSRLMGVFASGLSRCSPIPMFPSRSRCSPVPVFRGVGTMVAEVAAATPVFEMWWQGYLLPSLIFASDCFCSPQIAGNSICGPYIFKIFSAEGSPTDLASPGERTPRPPPLPPLLKCE
jgi:hypothetical protein